MRFWRFGDKFLYLLNWFFVWSSPPFILIKKATYGVIMLKYVYVILKIGSALKLLFLIEMLL